MSTHASARRCYLGEERGSLSQKTTTSSPFASLLWHFAFLSPSRILPSPIPCYVVQCCSLWIHLVLRHGPCGRSLGEELGMRPLAATFAEANMEGRSPQTSTTERVGIDGENGLVLTGLVGADEVVGGALGPTSVCTLRKLPKRKFQVSHC